MDWGQVLTIIFGVSGFMSIFVFLLNKRLDDLKQDMDRRFDKVYEDMREIKEDIRELRRLLYKITGVESEKKA